METRSTTPPAVPRAQNYPHDYAYENLGYAQAQIRQMLAVMKAGNARSDNYRTALKMAEEALAKPDWINQRLADA